MTFPSDVFGGVPAKYQGHLTFVPSSQYAGGGYYSAYGRGRRFSFAEMETLWNDAGGDPRLAGLMAAIGENESGGYVGDWNSTGATSIWEIEYPGSSPKGVTREQLFNPRVNAKAAVELSGNNVAGIRKNWPGTYPKGKIPDVPPAKNIKGIGSSSNQGSPPLFSGPLGQFLANPIDSIERLALILFGGLLVVTGIWIITMTPARAVARDFGLLGPKKGKGKAALSPEDQEDKERRMALAEKNAGIGERRVRISEAREERIGRVSRIHGGRTGGREPNPEPVHE